MENALVQVRAPLTAFIVAFLLLRGWLLAGAGRLLLDQPNHRSLHGQAVPRSGGIAIMAGGLAGWGMLPGGGGNAGILGLVCVLFIISLLDDWRGLPVLLRLMVHVAVSCAAVALYAANDLPWAEWVLLTLAVTWAMNAYNFMDGADGLAGGMASIGFGVYAVAAWQAADLDLAGLCASLVAASLAFLWFNRPPARVFMGDAGAIPLGFLAAGLGLVGYWRGCWPGWFPLLVFSPFLLDATLTLLKRLLRGKPLWQAHREHYYQRFILLGHGHGQMAVIAYALMLGIGISSLWVKADVERLAWVVMGWAGIYAGLMISLDFVWARRGGAAA